MLQIFARKKNIVSFTVFHIKSKICLIPVSLVASWMYLHFQLHRICS